MTRSIVLFSGGIDSTVALASTLDKGHDCIALFFSYGQRHLQELEAAREITEFYGVPLEIRELSLSTKSCSSTLLANSANTPPKGRSVDEILQTKGAPATYVPGRNTIFLAHALSLAEMKNCQEVVFGPNAHDVHFPDCVPAFVEAMQQVYKAGVETPVLLRAPLIEWDKTRIIQEGKHLRAPLSYTLSCYHPFPQRVHCGECDACTLRKKGFKDAGVTDPTKYNHLMQTHS